MPPSPKKNHSQQAHCANTNTPNSVYTCNYDGSCARDERAHIDGKEFRSCADPTGSATASVEHAPRRSSVFGTVFSGVSVVYVCADKQPPPLCVGVSSRMNVYDLRIIGCGVTTSNAYTKSARLCLACAIAARIIPWRSSANICMFVFCVHRNLYHVCCSSYTRKCESAPHMESKPGTGQRFIR